MKIKKYKAIIIDDESAAREILTLELKDIAPDFEIVALCSSFEEAKIKLSTMDIDVAFIDIIMPRGNGLELLREFPDRTFYPIIVSSHVEYAVEAIREEAFDYILKPFSTEELESSLSRFRQNINKNISEQGKDSEGSLIFEAKDQSSSVFIKQQDICYLEADGSYTRIVYGDKEFVMSKNLKHLSSFLNDKMFYRCSNQCVVNLSHIDSIDHPSNSALLKDGTKIQISIRRKEELLNRLRNP